MFQIDVEKLAGFLPLHLIAVLISSDKDEALFKYLLCGLRFLHSLCDLAPRQNKLEQVDFINLTKCFVLLFIILFFIFCMVSLVEQWLVFQILFYFIKAYMETKMRSSGWCFRFYFILLKCIWKLK